MTKTFNFALKIKGVVGRVAHAKSSDPATPPKKNLERAQGKFLLSFDAHSLLIVFTRKKIPFLLENSA